MADPARVYAGFASLFGVDGGLAPDLIATNKAALSNNVTYRGGIPSTRPPWWGRTLNIPFGLTDRWTGKYQGGMFYDGEAGQSGFIVSRGGRLFFITPDTWIVSEITPRTPVVTTTLLTVPAPAAHVTVGVNTNEALSVGDTIFIDTGQYTVFAVFIQSVDLIYVGGAAHATVAPGAAVLDASLNQVIDYATRPPDVDFIFMFQAENYAIILGNDHTTIIFDGVKARLAGVDEVPPGVLGAYGWGRIWITQPSRRTFVAGDIVFGPSGTVALGKRDAILKFTENTFLNEGGAFGVPYNAGPITGMQFLATQDTSLGIGVLLVSCPNMVFSVNAPTDRTTWKDLQYPIQTVSLIDYGPLAPRSAVTVNGDWWYRSYDGFRSFIVARRNFPAAGNTPQSREIDPILENDTGALLFYGSGILFDNKLYETVSPEVTEDGIIHKGFVVINWDLVSNIGGKAAPAWEGANSGLDIFQTLKGTINGEERAFIFARGTDLELWEMQEEGTDDSVISETNITTKEIEAFLDTRSEDFGQPTNLKKLYTAEVYVDDVAGPCTLKISYRPDQYPLWIEWQTLTFCASVAQCNVPANCGPFKQNSRLYATRVMLKQPEGACNALVQAGIVNEGMLFQFKLEWTGHLRIRKFIPHAKLNTQPMEGGCQSEVACVLFPFCQPEIFGYDSHPPSPPIIIINDMALDQATYVPATVNHAAFIAGIRQGRLMSFDLSGNFISSVQVYGPTLSQGSIAYIGGSVDKLYAAVYSDLTSTSIRPNPQNVQNDVYPVDPVTFAVGTRLGIGSLSPFANGFEFIPCGPTCLLALPGTTRLAMAVMAASGNYFFWVDVTNVSNHAGFAALGTPSLCMIDWDAVHSVLWGQNSDGGRLYNWDLNVTSNHFAVTQPPYIFGVAVCPVNNSVYMSTDTGSVIRYDITGNAFTTISLGRANARPIGIRFNPFNGLVYVACTTDNTVCTIDPANSNAVTVHAGFDSPIDIVATPTKVFAVQQGPVGLKEIL